MARSSSGFQKLDAVLADYTDHLRELSEIDNPSNVSGTSTGFPDLDPMTSGMQDGQLIIIPGRPAKGKTEFGLNIALHVGSLETDAPVAGLRWKSLRPCSYAIGRQVSDLVFCTDENGLLVELQIIIDDGGRLVVGGGRPACEHDEEAMPQAV